MAIGGVFEGVEVTPESQKTASIIRKKKKYIKNAKTHFAQKRMKSSRRSDRIVAIVVIVIV
jgi:hypothetical protein